jgi:hypothetical protein
MDCARQDDRQHPRRATKASQSPLPAAFDGAATLANDLAELARRTGDARLAKLTTDALAIATNIHAAAELLAALAGMPEREP